MERFYIINGPSLKDIERNGYDVIFENDAFACEQLIIDDVHIPCIFEDDILFEISSDIRIYSYLKILIDLFPNMILFDEYEMKLANELDSLSQEVYLEECSERWKDHISEYGKTRYV